MVEPSAHDIAVAVKFLDCEPSAARHLAQLLATARADGDAQARRKFVVQAQNLVRDTCQDALATARAEGRREAIEAAKAIVRNHLSRHQNCEYSRGCCEVMEEEIRALAAPPADADKKQPLVVIGPESSLKSLREMGIKIFNMLKFNTVVEVRLADGKRYGHSASGTIIDDPLAEPPADGGAA